MQYCSVDVSSSVWHMFGEAVEYID